VNGGILAISSIIPTVCSSAAESEYAALFLIGQHGIWLRNILQAMGYTQKQPTLIVCDNSCAVGIANRTVKMKQSKAINMRYHWIQEQIQNNVLQVSWIKGIDNFADFFTKALPVYQHQNSKSRYVSFTPDPDNRSLNSTARYKQRFSRHLLHSTETLAKGVC
jgi:hypothetical protein